MKKRKLHKLELKKIKIANIESAYTHKIVGGFLSIFDCFKTGSTTSKPPTFDHCIPTQEDCSSQNTLCDTYNGI